MITATDLRVLASAKLDDAQVLFDNSRYDGAKYVCGYALELTLKARICDTLDWTGYPETRGEFDGLSSFRVHSLPVLLHLSGRENVIKRSFLSEWSTVRDWGPEMRYEVPGRISPADALAFLQAANTLVQQL